MSVAPLPIPYADLNGGRFPARPNANSKKTALDHVSTFNDTAEGAFRVLQLVDRSAKLVSVALKEMGNTMASSFEEVSSKVNGAWTFLTLPRLPKVTRDAYAAVTGWLNPPQTPLDAKRDNINRVHDIADFFASWFYAGSLFAGSSVLKTAGDVPDLIANMTGLATASQDWSLAKKHLEVLDVQDRGNTAVHNRFVYTLRHAFIKMVKAICSVASGVLGLLVLGFGGPVLPAAVLIGISLLSTVSAMAAYFYKETSPYEMVDFFKVRDPEPLVAGVPPVY